MWSGKYFKQECNILKENCDCKLMMEESNEDRSGTDYEVIVLDQIKLG